MGQACLKFGLMFKSLPRGLFISAHDGGAVQSILKNWPERRVRVISITDGASVLGLGDAGIQGMGLSVSQTACYTSCGGLVPHVALPISIDVGCDAAELVGSPYYVGLKQRRAQVRLIAR